MSAFDLFILQRAPHKALRLIRGLRRQVTDVDESIMTKKIIDELDIRGWEIAQKPSRSVGFVIRTQGLGDV